jgi:hypothetical protein
VEDPIDLTPRSTKESKQGFGDDIERVFGALWCIALLFGGVLALAIFDALSQKTLMGVMCMAFGVFAIAGGLFDWRWFMSASEAKPYVKSWGHDGARVFYVVGGLLLAGGGVCFLLDGIRVIKLF